MTHPTALRTLALALLAELQSAHDLQVSAPTLLDCRALDAKDAAAARLVAAVLGDSIEVPAGMAPARYELAAGRCILRDGTPFAVIRRCEDGPRYVEPSEVDALARAVATMLGATA